MAQWHNGGISYNREYLVVFHKILTKNVIVMKSENNL